MWNLQRKHRIHIKRVEGREEHGGYISRWQLEYIALVLKKIGFFQGRKWNLTTAVECLNLIKLPILLHTCASHVLPSNMHCTMG